MSRLLALSGETVKVKGGDGEDYIFTITAFDPVAGKYIGLGHRSASDPVGKTPLPARTAYLDGTDGLFSFPTRDTVPHPLLGPVTAHNHFGICGTLRRMPRQGLLWTAKAQEGMAYIISSAFADVCAPSVDVLPVAIPIEITKVTNERWSGGQSEFIFTGLHVKGMSGSPIIQNGCIVGALYGGNSSDKTGVGVHIDQMLEGLYKEGAKSKVRKADYIHKTGSGKRGIKATQRRVQATGKKCNTLAASFRRVRGNVLYLDRLIADAPKFQALRNHLAAYEAGRISDGILFEKQKRTYPEALKLLWDYDQASWKAALKTWEDRGVLTREQRTAIERCVPLDV